MTISSKSSVFFFAVFYIFILPYTIVTIAAFCGLRISEILSIKTSDISLESSEIKVRNGKGGKSRLVFMGSKVVNAVREYLKERDKSKGRQSEYLFISQRGGKLDRTVVNKLFNKYSSSITPHSLRHFYCTNALENGFSIHEVANQAGHSNIQTTLLYTNPSRKALKEKVNLL